LAAVELGVANGPSPSVSNRLQAISGTTARKFYAHLLWFAPEGVPLQFRCVVGAREVSKVEIWYQKANVEAQLKGDLFVMR